MAESIDVCNSVIPASESEPQEDVKISIETSGSPETDEKRRNNEKTKEGPKRCLLYEYEPDQWSPYNPQGKRSYSKDFLLKLQKAPLSLQKPKTLPDLDIIKSEPQKIHLRKALRAPWVSPTKELEPEHLRKLFLGGIAFTTTEEMLEEHFEQYGEILECEVIKTASRRTRYFGFVTYKNSEMADAAAAAVPHIIDDREIEIRRAVPPVWKRGTMSRRISTDCFNWREKSSAPAMHGI